jgi:hypothetical protein
VSNQYLIRSLLSNDFVIDVPHSQTTPIGLHIWSKNGNPNQLWTFEQGATNNDQNFFFIRSALGHNLVIDVPHSRTADRTQLQTYGKNSGNNQLWTPVDCAESDPNAFAIQSLLDYPSPTIVMDVEGAIAKDGTRLNIYDQHQTSSNNQAWHLEPRFTFTQQKITSITSAGTAADGTEIVKFIGTNFRPASSLRTAFNYTDAQLEAETPITKPKMRADFAGGFVNYAGSSPASVGVHLGIPGQGRIDIWDNGDSSLHFLTSFTFDGTSFHITFSGLD